MSPRAIPQLADADELMAGLARRPGVRYPVLVPNARGLARAEAAGVDAIAVFTAATDAFTTANIGMTVEASLEAFRPVLARPGNSAGGAGPTCRPPSAVHTRVASTRRSRSMSPGGSELGVDEICFGDTIGVGVPDQVAELVSLAEAGGIPVERQAYHFHDTRGTALANVAMALAAGIRTFDSSTGGTGGCPYAPGAAGNLATEDLVYFLDASGWEHGVSLDGVLVAARFIADALGKPLTTKVGQAGGWDRGRGRRPVAEVTAAHRGVLGILAPRWTASCSC